MTFCKIELEFNFIGEIILKKNLKSYLILFPIAAGIVVLDQWTKSLIRNTLAFGEIWSPWVWLTPYARVVHWHNTGVAFGMFQNNNFLFAILVSIIALVIIIYYPQLTKGDRFLMIALSMQLGGAVGNLIDRVTDGYVTDFISVGNFAVFNVADASVTVGVGIMIFGLWVQENKQRKKNKEGVPEPKEMEQR